MMSVELRATVAYCIPPPGFVRFLPQIYVQSLHLLPKGYLRVPLGSLQSKDMSCILIGTSKLFSVCDCALQWVRSYVQCCPLPCVQNPLSVLQTPGSCTAE